MASPLFIRTRQGQFFVDAMLLDMPMFLDSGAKAPPLKAKRLSLRLMQEKCLWERSFLPLCRAAMVIKASRPRQTRQYSSSLVNGKIIIA